MDLASYDWAKHASQLQFPTKPFIDGKFVDALSGETFETVNPATGAMLASVAACGADDVDAAVRAGRTAFEDGRWSGLAPEARKEILLKLADAIAEHMHEFALIDSLEVGKPIMDAATIDAPGSSAILKWYAEAIDKVYDEIAPTGSGDLALIRREALGVVGAVVPWNAPLEMAIWKLGPALATGNSVVLKPAEQSPLSVLRLAELAVEAGLPAGVLNVVPGFGEVAGKALGLHPDVDCISFTGSTEVGKYFLSYAAQSNMKQIWLECGGKSPNLIFADCEDLDAAADMAAFGIFYNQGEICSANSRILVEASIAEAFTEKLVEKAKGFYPADPLDPETKMGAMVDETQADAVMGYIAHGKESATLATGGNRIAVNGNGCFIEPTIFTNVDPSDKLAREEIFGPVLAIIPFSDEDEAVRIANDSPYGLAASVWTSNISRALRLSDKLKVGTVSVNTVDALSQLTPFGGFKQSGFGRDLSLHAFDKFSGLKTVWIKY